jgi:RHS repeat-associated protein
MKMRRLEAGRVRRSWLSRQVSLFLCLTLLVETGPAMALPAGGIERIERVTLKAVTFTPPPAPALPAQTEPGSAPAARPRPWRIEPVSARKTSPAPPETPASSRLALAPAAPPAARLITQEPPNPPGMNAAAPPAATPPAARIVRASSGTPGVDPGWNLVSLLRQPADPSPAAVFSSLSGSFARVFAYDACDAADPWKVYDPADPAGSDLTSVDIKKGLWIEATAGGTLPAFGSEPQAVTLHLCPGWNLIGFPAEEPRSVETVLAPIAGKYARVIGFDIADLSDPWEIYDVAVPGWADDLKLLQPGRGYWILATADADLTILRQQAPVTVALTTPSDLGVVTAPTDVLGTVTGDALQSWTLSYRAEGAADWTRLAAGTSAVTGGRLGAFDPTLLLNGPYELELAATDSLGEIHFADADINVEGQLKVGLFTLTFSDLEVGLAGLPIQILRTYDSRDKSQGDFGIGWRLEIRQGSYTNNRKPGEGWQLGKRFLPCDTVGETKGHQTTIRLSDREIYRFKLALFRGVPSFGGCFAQARFDFVDGPVPGATLDITGNTQVLYQNGGNEVLDPNSLELYEPQQVRLTTRDGRLFDLDLHAGVTHLEDTNGNALSITSAGITHSSGRTVTFERDSAGRIIRVTDPENQSLVYTYDTAGDLVEARDREANPTKFTYDTKHLLLDVENALGVKAVRSEYDAAGRLIKTTDAAGKAIEFTHDLAARREVVTDRLLHTRVLEYDGRGNVVREVDPAGGVTLRTFDAKDNLLTETDPLGHATVREYDSKLNLTRFVDALGHESRSTYDSQGRELTSTDPLGHVTTNAYDEKGNLLSITDPLGNQAAITYDARGNVLTHADAEGGVTRFEVDAQGNVIKEVNPLGVETASTYDGNGNRLTKTVTRTTAAGPETLTWRFQFDALGQLIATTDPDGTGTQTVYGPLGEVRETVDKLGRRIRHDYDDMGHLIRTTYPDGTAEAISYDAEGRRASWTDRAGRTTRYDHDALGRVVKNTWADGAFVTSIYDAAGHLTASTDARGNTTAYEYDAAGRRTRVHDAQGHETVFAYDAKGNRTTVTDARGATTAYEVDAGNRLVRTVFPDGGTEQLSYDREGRKVSETDAAGRMTRFGYDAAGRLVTVTDALGQVTRYAYDELGNRVAQTDPAGHATRFEYDRMGRPTKRILPLGAAEAKAYDAAGRLARRVDFNGAAVTYDYDAADRLVRRSYPDGSAVTFSYTPTGRRATATDARGTTSYSYDIRDRLTGLSEPDGSSLTYAYDAQGNRTSLTAALAGANLATSWGYDTLNRPSTVTDPAGRAYGYTYDDNGNRASVAYPNGVATRYTYDARNRLTDLTTRTGVGEILQSYAYTLGPSGNRVRVAESDGTVRAWEHDDLYRLTKETVTSGAAVSEDAFAYGPVGNRLTQQRTDANGTRTLTSTYDERDRLLSADGAVYAWDANGNLLSKSAVDGATYAWDLENHLVRVTKADGTVVTHAYDADGNRVRTEVTPPNGPPTATAYLVDPTGPLSQVIAETDGSGHLTAYYVRGDDLLAVIRPTGTRYYHADGLGSIRALTNETGAVTDRYTFSAFGELRAHTGSDPNAYLFAGEALDANSGFYYLRARWMDPASGRFASTDLYGGNENDPRSLHKYTYAYQDPVNLRDPSGLLPDWLVWAVVGTYIHTAIGADFVRSGGGRIANSTIGTILAVPGRACIPDDSICNLRPDLVDSLTGEVYEIKPVTQQTIGFFQLGTYLAFLNLNDPQGRLWFFGYSYIPPTYLFIDKLGGWDVVVFPPSNGVIAYKALHRTEVTVGLAALVAAAITSAINSNMVLQAQFSFTATYSRF